MKNLMVKFVMLFVLAATHLIAVNFPMNQLKLFAGGLNIEGGKIAQKYLKKGQVWSNLCVVLDRPFEDGLEWQELTKLNSFPLKEASILDYNEAQVNFAYATVMHYYTMHAHEIASKPADEPAKILLQVHRNTSGPCHVRLLEKLSEECYPSLKKFKKEKDSSSKYELSTYFYPDLNVEIDFCYGAAPENLGELGKYEDVDIVLSFSLVAGFDPNWKSGSLFIPKNHIPFCMQDAILSLQEEYFVRNHLIEVLPDIIETQDETIISIINHKFNSLNIQKNHHTVRKMCLDDFKVSTLLQVDTLFNPSQLPPTFNCRF